MLGNSLRKRLSEQNWINIIKEDSNPTQTWNRGRDKVNRGINDIILLAQKLPNDKQEELFNINNIKKIAVYLLQSVEDDRDYDEIRCTKNTLSGILAEKGLLKCMSQYNKIIQKRPELSEATTTQLQKAISICNAIALEIESRQYENDNENLIFLFEWNKICRSDDDDNKLKQLLVREFDIKTWIESAHIEKSHNDNTISIIPAESNNRSSISIKLNDMKTSARLSVCNDYDNEVSHKNLVVKINDGTLSVYTRKNKKYKNKTKEEKEFGSNTLSAIFS